MVVYVAINNKIFFYKANFVAVFELLRRYLDVSLWLKFLNVSLGRLTKANEKYSSKQTLERFFMHTIKKTNYLTYFKGN